MRMVVRLNGMMQLVQVLVGMDMDMTTVCPYPYPQCGLTFVDNRKGILYMDDIIE